MNHMPLHDETIIQQSETERTISDDVVGSLPNPGILRLRAVHRAISDLKRGTPVVLAGSFPLVLLAAETASARGLHEFSALSAVTPALVVATARAADLLGTPLDPGLAACAIALSPFLFEQAPLRGLADPTAEQLRPHSGLTLTTMPEAASAALALIKLARLLPAVITAPVSQDVRALVDQFDLLCVNAEDVLAYSANSAVHLVRVAEASIPLENVLDARVVAFRSPDLGIEHLAILVGRPENTLPGAPPPLVRLHSECFTGDLLGSLRCDCGPQLRGAIRRMAEEGSGVLLYLAQEGRGIGLVNKLRAYALQDRGMDTLDANAALGWRADERDFFVAAVMLHQLGINRIRLLTNNPEKVAALVACGVDVVARERHAFAPNGVNDGYLATKAERFGHIL